MSRNTRFRLDSPTEHGRTEGNPYIGLWAAVLLLACDDCVGRSMYATGNAEQRRNERKYQRTCAIQYLKDDLNYVGSFAWICGLLGLEPEVVRERIFKGCYHNTTRGRRTHWRMDNGHNAR